jgi:hypothetical protein
MNNTTTSLLAILLLIGAVIFLKNVPELRRYARINSM